jgi:anti-sigma B factor antagonist
MPLPSTPLWSYTTSSIDGVTDIALTGDLDLYSADALRSLLRRLLDTAGTRRLVADLQSVTFLDSAALGSLVRTYQHAVDLGSQFTITGLTGPVRRTLEITGTLEILAADTRS